MDLNARNCAEDGDEKNAELYELNARTLVTLWDKTSHLHEYSYRLWGGLVSSFYYPRWKNGLMKLVKQLIRNKSLTRQNLLKTLKHLKRHGHILQMYSF